jgi:hypothetical protein
LADLYLSLYRRVSHRVAASPEIPEPGYPLRAGTQLVVVDVVVNDAKGSPVLGLEQADFAMLENNKSQAIESFEAHVKSSAQQGANTPATPTLPKGYSTNFSPCAGPNALNVLLLNSLNTPLIDQSLARDQLRQILKKSPSAARIAIVGLNNYLILLQGFTSDPRCSKRRSRRGRVWPPLCWTTSRAAALAPCSGGCSRFMGSTSDMEWCCPTYKTRGTAAGLQTATARAVHAGRAQPTLPLSRWYSRTQESDLVLGLLSHESDAPG